MESELYKSIVSNSEVCGGRATIKGTRLTVKTIMEHVIAGDSDEILLEAFPRLTKESLKHCKEFTTLLLDSKTLMNSFDYKNENASIDMIPRKKIRKF
ncbi:DUF433 domain-containing protein [Hanamia caeni]|jgi:uncharacterized protein (DUF433 family)|uniref:DUF433 domain-containing protein n=1 Tax=Hanamia caeni TaxID=2294116 RepID=A0A3M9NQ71_9BACT|nr:DUF433 domain-containing protein [Hanamia caeni]RNI39939.1 DUF433 domain-containing protein [Hanamia caeni]